jgi:phage shock protein C
MKRLYKSNTDRKIDGVCAGVAEYVRLDPSLVRVLWALFALFGAGVLAYIVCMILIPRAPEDYTRPEHAERGNEN